MVCLDSDVLINFLRKDNKTIKFFEKLKLNKEVFATTSINSFELMKGIPKSSKMEKVEVNRFLSNFKIYNFDYESSIKASEIFHDLKSKGKIIDLADIMVASIAIINNETLISENTGHFARIESLKINII